MDDRCNKKQNGIEARPRRQATGRSHPGLGPAAHRRPAGSDLSVPRWAHRIRQLRRRLAARRTLAEKRYRQTIRRFRAHRQPQDGAGAVVRSGRAERSRAERIGAPQDTGDAAPGHRRGSQDGRRYRRRRRASWRYSRGGLRLIDVREASPAFRSPVGSSVPFPTTTPGRGRQPARTKPPPRRRLRPAPRRKSIRRAHRPA